MQCNCILQLVQYHKDGEIDDYSYWMIETDGRLIVIWDLFSQPDDSGSLFMRKLEPSFLAFAHH